MIKNQAVLEAKIGDKTFTLLLPNESSLGEAHDALFQMRAFIVNRINEVNEMAKQHEEKPEEPKVE
jgi:hypothetical protein